MLKHREEGFMGEPGSLRSRHLAVMDLMVTRPDLNQNQIAEAVGYTASRLSIVVTSPLFQLAFKEYRKQFEGKLTDNLVDLITDATRSAITFSKGVVENTNVETNLRQTSARDILNQGHVKAAASIQVNRRNLNANVDIPFEALEGLREVIQEARKPVDISRRTFRPSTDEDSGREAPTAQQSSMASS
jgi:hypothetical protein